MPPDSQDESKKEVVLVGTKKDCQARQRQISNEGWLNTSVYKKHPSGWKSLNQDDY